MKIRGRWFSDGALHCYIQGAVASILDTPSPRVVTLSKYRAKILQLLSACGIVL